MSKKKNKSFGKMKSRFKDIENTFYRVESKVEDLQDEIRYRQNRPLIRFDKQSLAILAVCAEILFKAYVIYSLVNLSTL